MNDETIAALERAAALIENDDYWSRPSKDAALIRALIERECAGGERAQIVAHFNLVQQIVAYVDDYDPTMADAILERFAGAHKEQQP